MGPFSFESIVKLSLLVVGIISATIALFQYYFLRRWRKQEFLSNQIKDFFNDPFVDKALLMIDWNYYTFNIENDHSVIDFNSELLISSLEFHEDRKTKHEVNRISSNDIFTLQEKKMREIFDKFFYKLGIFQNNIDNKLYKHKELKPYISYYIEILGDAENKRKSVDERNAIWNYIIKYKFDSVKKLLLEYDYDIQKKLD